MEKMNDVFNKKQYKCRAINVDRLHEIPNMTIDDLDRQLEIGINDMRKGNVKPANIAFKEILLECNIDSDKL